MKRISIETFEPYFITFIENVVPGLPNQINRLDQNLATISIGNNKLEYKFPCSQKFRIWTIPTNFHSTLNFRSSCIGHPYENNTSSAYVCVCVYAFSWVHACVCVCVREVYINIRTMCMLLPKKTKKQSDRVQSVCIGVFSVGRSVISCSYLYWEKSRNKRQATSDTV